jgi:cytolysin-activating lysine-acyltransferase
VLQAQKEEERVISANAAGQAVHSKRSPHFQAAAPSQELNFAQAFAQIVAAFMLDRNLRAVTVADLEWLVLPPVMLGQFRLAHGPSRPLTGQAEKASQNNHSSLVPVAAALWARVSPRIDGVLCANLDNPVKLSPADWNSGDIIWLVTIGGDPRALPRFLAELVKREFEGQSVKMRRRRPDGKVEVKVIGAPTK